MKKYAFMILAALTLMACSKHTYVVKNDTDVTSSVALGYPKATGQPSKVRLPETKGEGVIPINIYPNATAFRMSGDYSKNVAVTLGQNGELIYFPAPTDITADSEPIELCDGWWLNNQGLGPNSVFTKYTFAEYSALPEVPTIEQIKLSIIPGAKVTGFRELPMKLSEANQNIEAAKASLK